MLGTETGWEIRPLAVMDELRSQCPDEEKKYEADNEYAEDLGYVVTHETDGVLTPVIDEVNPFVVRANG